MHQHLIFKTLLSIIYLLKLPDFTEAAPHKTCPQIGPHFATPEGFHQLSCAALYKLLSLFKEPRQKTSAHPSSYSSYSCCCYCCCCDCDCNCCCSSSCCYCYCYSCYTLFYYYLLLLLRLLLLLLLSTAS